MNIYFLRHAQSMGNLTDDYSTLKHDELSPLGIKQSKNIVNLLKKYHFDIIISSPAKRAMQTIMPYLKENKLKAEIIGMLTECCWQKEKSYNTNNLPAIRKGNKIYIESIYKKFFCVSNIDKIFQYNRPDDETYQEGLARICFIKSIFMKLYNKLDKSILIVSHGYFISRFIEILMQLPPKGRFDIENASLSCVSILNNNIGKLKFLNLQ